MEQQKPFPEVFPDYPIPKDMSYILSDAAVTGVDYKERNRQIVVHLKINHLLKKKAVRRLAVDMKQKLFGAQRVFLSIDDTYELSSAYTLEQLTKEYWDSFLEEAGRMGNVEHTLLLNSSWEFAENVMTLSLPDSFLSRNKSKTIQEFFEERFLHQFGREVKVGFHYYEGDDSAFHAGRDHKLRAEVDAVMNRNGRNEPDSAAGGAADSGTDSGAVSDSKAGLAGQKAETKKEKKTGYYSGNFYEERARRQEFGPYNNRGKKDPDIIYGKNCEGEVLPIEEIVEEIGEVVVRGRIISLEAREIRNERTIISFTVTDFTDSIVGKLFLKNEQVPEFLSQFKEKNFYKIKGMPRMDTFERDLVLSSISGIKPIADFTEKRMDTSYEKRVELHLHTTMSEMDSVVNVKKAIETAKAWGHPALGITDHGVLQAFPAAHQCVSKDEPFKVLYGMEGYFVDDLKKLAVNDKGQSLDAAYVVFDMETTGFSPIKDAIIEIGAVKVEGGEIRDRYSVFVNPGRPIPPRITELTSIDDAMVADAATIETILPEFLAFSSGCGLVAHNAEFDMSFIEMAAERLGLPCDFTVLDTMQMSRLLLPKLSRFRLNTVCKHLGIKLEHHHRAVDDAEVTAKVYLRLVQMLHDQGVTTVSGLNEMGSSSAQLIKKDRAYHGILFVKNETGRVNLNRLVSASHLEYFHRRPRIPKSLIEKYREGLLVGSACVEGELFQAILREKSEEEIARIVNFYDYLEIQPIDNNRFMIDSDRYEAKSEEDLREYNRRIVRLGEQYGKPVAATGDVHVLNPEDERYRSILRAGKGFADTDKQPPLYFRTTEEMLAEFSYLGEQKAKEVVITNPNKIADSIEKISPLHPDKCPPVIPKSDETLTELCYKRAHEIYGPDLPEPVQARLDRELTSIISNGFAVMYIIAQKLVSYSYENGYLVGSRGSVGSSFVATMSGITEVNPLPPHYICPQCHFTDFDSDIVKPYAMKSMSGCDMPDRDCPRCGTPLLKEGHDIPFETFLGFEGNKEPDIDLNFSGEFQARAHKKVEEIFGEGSTFRAGTIGTMAQKTAFGYVMKYCEERGIRKRRCEMERLAAECTGVKRTTGQHPGGIIVLPHEYEIYDFTAIQHPANDMETDIVTTHLGYHSIDHNLLKLDILGHDDPTMIRHLSDLTGVDARSIPLSDPEVMELFHGTEVLGIKPEDIGGVDMGSLGVPEFGTEFVMQMLKDTKPQCFSDLVRISGLSHGTSVWLGNARDLIESGQAEISTAICCRDDIMAQLIVKGMEKEEAFTIMESVRKGKGLKDSWIEDMKAHDVPQWYVDSCQKIAYMFPKAHAAAYVMMGWRVAWFKVHYPLEYYTAYFSIRASALSYEFMCRGKPVLDDYMRELTAIPKERQTKKDQDSIRDGRIAQEMYARGFTFIPIDIYTAKARECTILDGKIMPPLSSVEGLGDKACEQVEEAAKHGPFTSLDNLREQAKISSTVVEKMAELGIVKGLPASDQLTFDFLTEGANGF